ncbi:MAG: hypothetical protein IPM35_04655 [Myxococcales bacterium]|nr:hypothetical protein [Myxococcales bacterium]
MAFTRVPAERLRPGTSEPATGDAAPEPAMHLAYRWLAPRSRIELFSVMDAAALGVVVRFAAGDVDHVIVGAVRREGPLMVVRPWGGAEVAVQLGRVAGVAVVPAHPHQLAAEIRRRQRRGEPVLVLPRLRRGAAAEDAPRRSSRIRRGVASAR